MSSVNVFVKIVNQYVSIDLLSCTNEFWIVFLDQFLPGHVFTLKEIEALGRSDRVDFIEEVLLFHDIKWTTGWHIGEQEEREDN